MKQFACDNVAQTATDHDELMAMVAPNTAVQSIQPCLGMSNAADL
jgi:hypothetical protein